MPETAFKKEVKKIIESSRSYFESNSDFNDLKTLVDESKDDDDLFSKCFKGSYAPMSLWMWIENSELRKKTFSILDLPLKITSRDNKIVFFNKLLIKLIFEQFEVAGKRTFIDALNEMISDLNTSPLGSLGVERIRKVAQSCIENTIKNYPENNISMEEFLGILAKHYHYGKGFKNADDIDSRSTQEYDSFKPPEIVSIELKRQKTESVNEFKDGQKRATPPTSLSCRSATFSHPARPSTDYHGQSNKCMEMSSSAPMEILSTDIGPSSDKAARKRKY